MKKYADNHGKAIKVGDVVSTFLGHSSNFTFGCVLRLNKNNTVTLNISKRINKIKCLVIKSGFVWLANDWFPKPKSGAEKGMEQSRWIASLKKAYKNRHGRTASEIAADKTK